MATNQLCAMDWELPLRCTTSGGGVASCDGVDGGAHLPLALEAASSEVEDLCDDDSRAADVDALAALFLGSVEVPDPVVGAPWAPSPACVDDLTEPYSICSDDEENVVLCGSTAVGHSFEAPQPLKLEPKSVLQMDLPAVSCSKKCVLPLAPPPGVLVADLGSSSPAPPGWACGNVNPALFGPPPSVASTAPLMKPFRGSKYYNENARLARAFRMHRLRTKRTNRKLGRTQAVSFFKYRSTIANARVRTSGKFQKGTMNFVSVKDL